MSGLNFKNTQTKCYNEDDGLSFGTWDDEVSKFLYYDSTRDILKNINIPEHVADYGGANGLLKQFIPNAITIDKDPTKDPDIIDDILTHSESYGLVVLRYVLHYLNDYEVIKLFNNIKSKNILVIQFVNDDLISKYYNSVNEHKYFRTTDQLEALLPKHSEPIYQKSYKLGQEFYQNRLGNGHYRTHMETLKAYLI